MNLLCPHGAQLSSPHAHTHTTNKKAAYRKFDDHLLSLFVSSLYLASACGATIGSFTTPRYGRRFTCIFGGLWFIAGSVLQVKGEGCVVVVVVCVVCCCVCVWGVWGALFVNADMSLPPPLHPSTHHLHIHLLFGANKKNQK